MSSKRQQGVPIADDTQRKRQVMSDEWEGMWEAAVVAYAKASSS
jgi:hypothetical protein